jgi:hypothetical protein
MVMHLSMLTPRRGDLGKGWGFDIFTHKKSKSYTLGTKHVVRNI